MTGFSLYPYRILISIITLLVIIASCNEPSFVGEDLVDGDRIDFEVTEDFVITAAIAPSDSVLVFERFDRLSTHRIGQYEHPYFGQVRAEIAIQVVPQIIVIDTSETIIIDSVILALQYNTAGFYGDTTLSTTLNVFRLNEFYEPRDPYYSNHQFSYDPMPVGQLSNFSPKPTKPILRVIEGEDGTDTTQLAPQLRIPIDNAIGLELLGLDSTALAGDSLFLTKFNGFYLSTSDQAACLMGFHVDNPRTQLIIYYRGDGEVRQRRFVPETNFLTAQVYQHSYQSAEVGDIINIEQDQTMVFQGLTGLGTRLKIEGLEQLEGALINQARLRIYLDDLNETTDDIVRTIPRLLMFKEDAEGALSSIEDVRIEQSAQTSVNFGGLLEDRQIGNDTLTVYEMNITSHLQEVLRKGENPSLFLRANNTANLMGNSRAFGPGHPEFPIELRVIYTK